MLFAILYVDSIIVNKLSPPLPVVNKMAAVRHNIDADEARKFRAALTRLRSYIFKDDEQTKSTLSLLLDECIAVDASVYSFQNEGVSIDFKMVTVHAHTEWNVKMKTIAISR